MSGPNELLEEVQSPTIDEAYIVLMTLKELDVLDTNGLIDDE